MACIYFCKTRTGDQDDQDDHIDDKDNEDDDHIDGKVKVADKRRQDARSQT